MSLDYYDGMYYVKTALMSLSILGLCLYGYYLWTGHAQTTEYTPVCMQNPRLLYTTPCNSQPECLKNCIERLKDAHG